MKAVSNGFCILNAVACAALYATSPLSEGGLGLTRVCVVDFDVHHGNGTQDILCSSYDPRFLYVSLHAGGAEINGHPMEDDPNHELHDLNSQGGIYPGRCGDTSPHPGVLNIPLGAQVTPHAVGTALLNRVSTRVLEFCPDLFILSAGFDAHRADPMGLGDLRADDFKHITHVVCQLAAKTCSKRVISVLEGGYGVPCCRPQQDLFLPPKPNGNGSRSNSPKPNGGAGDGVERRPRPQPSKLLDLGDNLPENMDDQVPYALQQRLEKCHVEGFVECVQAHVQGLASCSKTQNTS